MKKEIWKDIKGYEGLYKVSSLGRFKSLSRIVEYNHSLTKKRHTRKTNELIMKKSSCKGYSSVNLAKEGVNSTHRVCRVIAKTFINNIENKPCVNHIDGNKSNDCVENLEWCTYSENMRHAKEKGLIRILTGSESSASISVKCTKTGKVFETIKDASKYAGCHSSHLSRVLRGEYKNNTTLVYA